MLYQFNDFDEFAKKAKRMGIKDDLKTLLTLNIMFYEEYDDYVILSLPDFDSRPNKIMVLSRKDNLVYPDYISDNSPLFRHKTKSRNRESSVTAFLVLKKVLTNYISYFETLNNMVDKADNEKDIEMVEDVSKKLKKLWDAVHDMERLLIELEQSTLKFVDMDVVGYDYDVLMAKANYLSDRCRGARKELSIIRTKIEFKMDKQLNRNIMRLTEVMTVLTIITVIISVPNTVATIFGVPTLAQLVGAMDVVWFMVIATIISVAVSMVYLKKWQL